MRCCIIILLIFSFVSAKGDSPRFLTNNSHHSNDLAGTFRIDPGGTYALIAGGSKGIGFAIAEALAKRGYNLVLIARHLDGLQIAKERLSVYNVDIRLLAMDLAFENTADSIGDWCRKNDLPISILCNVAGLGGTSDYLTLPPDSLRYMIDLNVASAAILTNELLPILERNAPSYVMNVSSMAGFAPIPSKNLYAATKSAVTFFSYALRYQLKESGISVSCLAPGPVYTKASVKRDTERTLGWLGKQMAVEPAQVGEVAVRRMLRGRMMIVPGTLASVSAFFVRLMPDRVAASVYYRVDKRKNKKEPEAIVRSRAEK